MQDLNDLFYFVQVIDHGGFAPAARAIGVPKSKLSRRVAQLEKRLGVGLIHRSTRNLAVTELGQAYYEHCAAMLLEAEAAQETIDRSIAQPQGLIRMSCPPGMLCFVVAEQLSIFMARYPRVRVELEASGRRVDVVREGFDLAIRVRFPPLEDSELNVRVLSASPQLLMAAPSLFEDYSRPKVPGDLNGLPSLDWVRPGHTHTWCLEGPHGASTQIDHRPRLVTDDLITLHRTALAGLGIVQLPLLVGGRHITEGTLVDALPGWAPRGGVVQAVFPSRRGLLPAVRALIDFLAERFADQDCLTETHRENGL
ncbi:LysR substrate-binding domain-containing protein [Salinisphaera sp. LB1]|uniref:LysR substrate-binding domain-containing protein n=1 Tax=Salinisphaera sp. LB1 TaxID=2183911 RepID=UPI000D7086C5|nr:LysR substrate-binding domain-containing protein [Salinisphaera sp. LB1]AWN17840.1 Transcriptional regulator, LysR family [Salinisphaera sp. LB1]